MVEFEFVETLKKPEEEDFKNEKKEVKDKADKEEKKTTEKTNTPTTKTEGSEELGLADILTESWNEIAVEKGYEPVLDKQGECLKKHTARI